MFADANALWVQVNNVISQLGIGPWIGAIMVLIILGIAIDVIRGR